MLCLLYTRYTTTLDICCSFLFFFFKQKTAYEMRISDWSSDVCSSDLRRPGPRHPVDHHVWCAHLAQRRFPGRDVRHGARHRARPDRRLSRRRGRFLHYARGRRAAVFPGDRSEEHTSELQSLMRISYAVFCLKKKKQHHTKHRLTLIKSVDNNFYIDTITRK